MSLKATHLSTITVKRKSDGELCVINESDFDKEHHTKVKSKSKGGEEKGEKSETTESSRRRLDKKAEPKENCPAALSEVEKSAMLLMGMDDLKALPEYAHIEGTPTQKNDVVDAILVVRARCA